MQEIEPFYNWRGMYIAADDPASPFYGREYSEFEYSSTIYNHYIHPQWDDFGSETLYLKVLYADYEQSFAVIEFIGEWNDAIGNDIMYLKRDIVDEMIASGITNFILIGENVLNMHGESEDYYEEWFDDIEDGWIVGLNFREHVIREFNDYGLDNYIVFGGRFDEINWRRYQPSDLFELIDSFMKKRLN
ncbi:MAG: hypothetical protein R2850_11565 [Bacteroidia bacterium]